MDKITPEENQKLCERAWAITAQKVMESLEKQGVTLDFAAQRLREGLDATEVKARYVPGDGWKYSKPLVAHDIRLRALALTSTLMGIEQVHRQPEAPSTPGTLQYIDRRQYAVIVQGASNSQLREITGFYGGGKEAQSLHAENEEKSGV